MESTQPIFIFGSGRCGTFQLSKLFDNFDSLKKLLEKVGFKIVLKESTFPIDLFLLMGKNYVGNDVIGRESHAMRKLFEINLAKANKNNLKRNLYRSLSELKLGREIIMLGKK